MINNRIDNENLQENEIKESNYLIDKHKINLEINNLTNEVLNGDLESNYERNDSDSPQRPIHELVII